MPLGQETRAPAPSFGGARRDISGGPVSEIQRARILSAAAEVIRDVGYARMTVAQVIGRAKVSRKSFYEVFADREDCFLATFDQTTRKAAGLVLAAYERESGWREGIRAGLASMLMFLDDEPGLARLWVVEALGAGTMVRRRRAQVLKQLAVGVDMGRSVTPRGSEPPEVTAEGVVGAVFAVLYTRLLEPGREPLTILLGPLMSMTVLPYLGVQAASEELSRPVPVIRRGKGVRAPIADGGPFEDLNMRLTYRTARVLSVIAEHPGANNREIAKASGIADQGQISKLLTRLARLRLVENTGEGPERGASNAWRLTSRGAQLERASSLR
jgi:AcrR family transcriptional regulator